MPKSSPSLTLFLLLLGVAGLVFVSQWRSRATVTLPAPLPAVSVQGWMNVDEPPTADDLTGKWVVVDFWATWCGPCVASMPNLAAFRERWRDQGVVVLGVSDDGADAMGLLQQVVDGVPGFEWPVAYGGSQAFVELGINAIPALVLYNPQGQKVWEGHDIAELEAVLQAE